MYRKATIDILKWYESSDRHPLIIRGARQVGKSTLVKIFAQEYGLDLLEINLEKVRLSSIKTNDFSINNLLDEIQLKFKHQINDRTLIFFDEIQESPLLLKFLRYFYEERNDLAIIAAGSLLEITLKNENFSFPVGRVEFYHLGPMTFSEFLIARGNDFLLEKIKAFEFTEPVVEAAKKELRNFYYVGGMPKAVKCFVSENSLVPVREIQEQIIQTYLADFPKYNKRINVERVEKIFYSVATYLGKKVIYTKLSNEGSSRDIKKALELLVDAKVIYKCIHSDANSSPLQGEIDLSVFKLYFLDIGLLNTLLDLDLDTIDLEMRNNFNTKGMLAEQFVAQHLTYLNKERRGPELFYWLKDKGIQKGEIDFLIQNKNKVLPIEVKAKAAGHLKSLFYFTKEKGKKQAVKVSLDDFSKEQVSHLIDGKKISFELISLPHYAIELIYNL